MLSTIVLLFIVGMITLFAAFAGYVIITAKTKTQEKIKKNQKVNPLPENQIRSYLPAF